MSQVPNSQINHIFECCKNGKTQQLLDALESTNDGHIVDERQNSILAVALKHGQWQTAESLINNNYVYFHEKKPGLIAACQYKKDDITGIELVLQINDKIDCQDKQKRTGLMTVCLLGHVKKATRLLENNADVSLQDNQGNTALMDAVQSKNKKLVQLILKQNLDVNQINTQGETALIIELKQKSPVEDIVNQLLKSGGNPETVDFNKKSAWLLAKQRHPKVARLIENHLNTVNQIELPFFSNDYQIKDQVKANTVEVIADTKPENKFKSDETISTLTSNDNSRMEPSINIKTAELTRKKPTPKIDNNLKTQNSKKNTVKTDSSGPLLFKKNTKKSNTQEWFHAAKSGNLGGLNRMLIEGIDIDCIDEKGCTALIRASGNSRRAVVSFLLQQNANIEARSHNGSTALSSSIIGNCRRVAGLLLDKGANVNALGPSNYTYVTIAAAQWNDAMLSILYRYGADIFVMNKQNQTLLHIIAMAAEYYSNVNNAKTSIQYLLDHGMDINAQDNNGDTALMVLCGSHKKKYQVDDRNIASIAHCLIKMGAAAAITNKSRNSALDACKHHKLHQTKGVIMNALSWND